MSNPKTMKEMTEAELAAADRDLDGVIRQARPRLRAVRHEIESRRVLVEARKRVAAMNPKERAALAKALGVEGIPSAEALGTPGARKSS